MTHSDCRSLLYSALILESAGMASGMPEHRLSSDEHFERRRCQGAASRSSDGSGTPTAEERSRLYAGLIERRVA